jgi:hypothetical protein
MARRQKIAQSQALMWMTTQLEATIVCQADNCCVALKVHAHTKEDAARKLGTDLRMDGWVYHPRPLCPAHVDVPESGWKALL